MKITDLVEHQEFGHVDFDDDEIIVDTFVIFRTIHGTSSDTRIAFCGTVGFDDNGLKLGTLQLVSDRIRDIAKDYWSDE